MELNTFSKSALFCAMLSLYGCGGSGSSAPVVVEPPPVVVEPPAPEPPTPEPPAPEPPNSPPVLIVDTPQQTVDDQQTTVFLNVNATDDQPTLTYAWSQKSGVPVALIDANTDAASFATPVVTHPQAAQQLVFEVVVTDSDNASSQSELNVTVNPNNFAPTAVIDTPANMLAGQTVTLSVAAQDSDGEVVSYLWQQVSGEAVTLQNADTANASFIAPNVDSEAGFGFKVTVTDNKQSSVDASIDVVVSQPSPPSLDTQELITAKSGAFTVIEWQATSGVPFNIELVQTNGASDLAIVMTDQNKAHFTAPVGAFESQYTLELTATNSSGGATTKTISVTVAPTASDVFTEEKNVLSLSVGGHDISNFAVADMDNDGKSDIIARQDNGTYWYKNKGDLELDMTPRFMRNEVQWNASDYVLLEDISGDSQLDLVTLQHKSDGVGLYYASNDGSGNFFTEVLIGLLPGVFSEPFDGELSVFTFEPEQDSGVKYIVAAMESNRNGFLFIFAPGEGGYSQVNAVEYQGSGVMANTALACDVKQTGKADLYYQTMLSQAGGGDKETVLHVLSAADNYQTETVISESSASDAALACMQVNGGNDRLVQYQRSEAGKNTAEIGFDSEQLTYQRTPFTSVLTQQSLSANNFLSVDINGDNLDDLIDVNHDNWVRNIFLRNNATDLTFTKTDDLGCACELTDWQESGELRLFRQQENTFWLSDNLEKVHVMDDSNGTVVPFDGIMTIMGITNVGTSLFIEQRSESSRFSTLRMKLVDGRLVEDNYLDENFFKGDTPLMADINNDGKKDAFFQYPKTREVAEPKDAIAVRLATEDGFGPIQELYLVGDTGEHYDVFEVSDVNNDGFFDISLRYTRYGDIFWLVYDPLTAAYQSKDDVSPEEGLWPQLNGNSGLADLNGDGLLDIIGIGQFDRDCTFMPPHYICGYLRENIQQSGNQFGDWTTVEQARLKFIRFDAYDVDQDGSDDIMFDGFKFVDEDELPITQWYKRQPDNTMVTYPLMDFPRYYLDLFGSGSAYFFDWEQNQQLISYEYSDLVKRPVVSEVQSMPQVDKWKNMTLDIDKDGDLDIVRFDNDNVYLIENKR